MNGRDILKFLSNLGKRTDWEYVDELTQRLKATVDRPIHTLSKGNVQKIGLILAFMNKPDLLILDEREQIFSYSEIVICTKLSSVKKTLRSQDN